MAVTPFTSLKCRLILPEMGYHSSSVTLPTSASHDLHSDKNKHVDLNSLQVKTNDGIENEVHIMTWEGTDPSLPSLLLNSHTDVVPVFQVNCF